MSILSKAVYSLFISFYLFAFFGFPAFAEESKGFFSWNSNFIKKSDSSKTKGIPANPAKKKVKGIPTQTLGKSDAELTESEKKTIHEMSAKANNDRLPASSLPYKQLAQYQVPKPPVVPRAPKLYSVPKNPNLYKIQIPSVPRAFSSNTDANIGSQKTTEPGK